MEIQKPGWLLTFPEILAQAGRRGCATSGLPWFVIHLDAGKKMIPFGYKLVFPSALQFCRAGESSDSKVRVSADGPQCRMKGWERGTSTWNRGGVCADGQG